MFAVREAGRVVTSVAGYLRVSTDDQGDNGHGLAAQEAAIRLECDRRGWEVAAVLSDVASGKTTARRAGLAEALEMCRSRRVDGLMVAKLDRLSRSLIDFANVLEDARRRGYNVVALDLGVDLSTPAGELVANVMASVAQWERRAIGERTRDGLRAAKAKGVKLGAPVRLDLAVALRISQMHVAGMSSHRIAAALNAEGVPSATGGVWWPKVVRQVIDREGAGK